MYWAKIWNSYQDIQNKDASFAASTGTNGTDDEEVTVTATWTASEGAHPLRVTIDPGATLNEVDITNNEKTITISVSAKSDEENNSFRMIAPKIWNRLPELVRQAKSLSAFKPAYKAQCRVPGFRDLSKLSHITYSWQQQ